MAGGRGCHDDCAAVIIYIFNTVALVLSFAGLGGICYLLNKETNRKPGDSNLSLFIPEMISVFGVCIFICLLVMAIAFLGIITTAVELKASQIAETKKQKTDKNEAKVSEQDKNGKVSHEKKPKGCCHNCGFLVYIGMSLFSFFFMLAVAVVSGAYSGQLDHINYVSKVKEFAGRDAWINALEYKLSSSALVIFNNYPDTWNKSQAALGCCGWNLTAVTTTAKTSVTNTTTGSEDKTRRLNEANETSGTDGSENKTDVGGSNDKTDDGASGDKTADDGSEDKTDDSGSDDKTANGGSATNTMPFNHADVVAYTKDSKCCKGMPVVTDINVNTRLKRDEHNCWVTGDRKSVYTCQAIAIKHMQDNMIIFCICTVSLAIVQLALAIAGCVVRFPRLYSCCACDCCCKKDMNKFGNAKVVAINDDQPKKIGGPKTVSS